MSADPRSPGEPKGRGLTLNLRLRTKQCPTCGRRFSNDAAFCPFDGVALVDAASSLGRDPLVGCLVDERYEVLEVLGEGGMGRVYRVRHSALGRMFAMKVLRPDLALDAGLAERFIQEAQATASIRHPSVVQITDFGRSEGKTPYFVMEYLVGQTLGDVLRAETPLAPGTAISILKHVARGVGAAHAAGVVHRDLKPDNVFLLGPGGAAGLAPPQSSDVRVVDFGAAKIMGASRITRAGVVFGTPHYMSPEQASGRSVDHRADIYAFGVIVYEMLTGKVPFHSDTYMGVLTQHIYAQPLPPSQVRPASVELGALESITLRCLAKRPVERFASMTDVLAALEEAERGGRASSPARTASPGLEPSPLSPPRPTGQTGKPKRTGEPKTAWLRVGTLALVLVTAAAAARALRSPAKAPPTASGQGAHSSASVASAPPSPAAPRSPNELAGARVDRAVPVGSAPKTEAPVRPLRRSLPSATAAPALQPGTRLDDVGDPFTGKP